MRSSLRHNDRLYKNAQEQGLNIPCFATNLPLEIRVYLSILRLKLENSFGSFLGRDNAAKFLGFITTLAIASVGGKRFFTYSHEDLLARKGSFDCVLFRFLIQLYESEQAFHANADVGFSPTAEFPLGSMTVSFKSWKIAHRLCRGRQGRNGNRYGHSPFSYIRLNLDRIMANERTVLQNFCDCYQE